jgi:Kef-type K+ transport system membrane component KefB/mannitol/fructose-specific phosphotransferase system IIA component (Ntr-type)
MEGLSTHDIALFFLAIAILLGCARIAAEIAEWLHQPSVVGEIFAGVLLGPTVFGALLPDLQATLFPSTGPMAIALSSLTTLAIVLFLLVAGMEIDLSAVLRQGTTAVRVGVVGIVAPFIIGFIPAYAAPAWFGAQGETTPVVFALFLATAMSITALPVIAKILFDLKVFQTDLGVTIVSAAILNDLVGWCIFAFVLAMVGVNESPFTPGATVLLTLIFAVAMLTLGRWGVNRTLPWIQAHTQWPGGVLAFALSFTLLSAAFTEWIGVHAIFGALLFGVALGDSSHLRQRTRATIDQFVSFIFAPLFFASIGLRADFVTHFDVPLVLVVLVIASVGKILGCAFAARWAGFHKREAWAVGFGMNARGAMEIVLGLLALQAGIISERLFVALVVMALVTSMASGFLIQRSFGRKRSVSFLKYVTTRTFFPELPTTDRLEAGRMLAEAAAAAGGVDPAETAEAVLRRERLFSSSMGNGLAIPHARLKGITQPIIAIGISRQGIESDAPDGVPLYVFIVLLAPATDPALHVALLGSIASAFRRREMTEQIAASVTTLTELRAMLRVESTQQDGEQAEEAGKPADQSESK